MVLDFFRSSGPSSVEAVEEKLAGMLRDGRDVYAAATDALFGGGKSKETKREVKSTDREINAAQRDVRRELLLHAAVNDAVDLPLVLSYMSVVKDAERVGDYAKNLYDLVRYGADFSDAEDYDELVYYRDAVGSLIEDACAAFEARDTERAQSLISKADDFLDTHDAHVKGAFSYEGESGDAVARALYFRFLKRITAHVMNLLTSLVMPIDRLDYYDEAKDDRE